MIQRAQTYYALINVALLLITTYTVREATLKEWWPSFSFWWLIAAGAAFVIIIIVVDYKIIYPSQIAFHQHEAWKARSPVRQELAAIKKSIAQIQEALGITESQDNDG